MQDAIVVGGSRGIGRAISEALSSIGCNVVATSSAQLDTSDLEGVRRFASANPETDVLVLNTGGPPPIEFDSITEQDWDKYHRQLFVGFCTILQNIRVRDGGYIFAITSGVIKEPSPQLIISGAYRAAFSSVFKVLSGKFAGRSVSCINIAPGPINTDRMRELVDDIDEFKAGLPMGRMGEPAEIGSLVKSIVQNKIKYLSGVTINFDGANSSCMF